MNRQEELYFAALSKDRLESAAMLEKPSMRGIKNSVVEKYSDQAHFIYELLQNADDAKATTARFVLEPNRLIFAHNGTRHFSVSDPVREDEDSASGHLGDINAITSIANSNKTEASIGKFGVGFKAVFQYTSTPHIYDPEFRFRIDRFIVPTPIDGDFPGRRKDETLFVFPFDHPERNAREAYGDISDKLRNLSFPLLFLSELKEIEFEFGNVIGLYGKNIEKIFTYGDTIAERICLTQNAGDELYDENLWLFSRLDDCRRRYSVGFFMDSAGHLKPVNEPAFCFFPTKEVTGLNFILHAPFLLTDSREGIRAGVAHNDKMIQRLSELAADSFEHLRDIGKETSVRLIGDNIVTIIPVDKEKFSEPSDKRKISFLPFYHTIKEKFEKADLLPSTEGYISSKDAYWAAVSQLPQLFSNAQLADITCNENAHWVFTTLARDEIQRNNRALYSYVDSLVRTSINEDVIITGRSREFVYIRGVRQDLENIKGITAEFIEAQTFEWLHVFYKWLSETKHRKEISVTKPVFLDQNGNAVAAFDDNDQLILFLPVKDVEGYTVVHPELLRNPETRQFIIDIGIKQPSLKDQIYNIILPRYRKDGGIDTKSDFKLFFRYYCKCSNEEVDEFIDLIKDYEFLRFNEDGKAYRTTAEQLYLPTAELKQYFASKPATRFVDYDGYIELVGADQDKHLTSFLSELGVRTNPITYEISDAGYYHRECERVIDGLQELINAVAESNDRTLSIFLWNRLCAFVDDNQLGFRVLNKAVMSRPDGRYNFRTEYEPSPTMIALKTTAWLLTDGGEFVSAENVAREHLSSDYDLESENAASLLDILGIEKACPNEDDEIEDDSNLTDAQREKIALADKLREYGIEDDEDLAEFQEFRRQKEAAKKAAELRRGECHTDSTHFGNGSSTDDLDHLFDDVDDYDASDEESPSKPLEKRAGHKTTTNVIKDIVRRAKDKSTDPVSVTMEETEDADADEFMPSSVDYSKKIERAKEKSAAEIDRIAYLEALNNKAVQLTQEGKYTVAWFNTLLEMESISSGEAHANSKEISISFAQVEREPGTKRTLVLKYPNRYIPPFMEDLADIPLVLHMGDQKKTVAIEVVNIKSYTLRVKMKNGADIDGIDLGSITAATIDAKSPSFLLEELRKQFAELELTDDFNMKDNLCENIEFVFGPPGTGKTTHLARNVLIPMMKDNLECKVLVLAPTNKSADVLVKRIMEVSDTDTSYADWLVRFGGTADEEIERSPVFRDKTFDIRTLAKNVTVTTIARFPYDFFMPHGARVFLHGMNWDYIVIDEASMIPIANIIFPLYKKTPRKFIISGDPFQIDPITSVELWKDENIYTMVELNSFVNPKTKPYQYKVELLTTQFRSVPAIGDIFSNFAYGGILTHYRSADSQRQLNVGNDLGVETLNIIKYPVSKYESIYRVKYLQHSSSYQVYSALFTFEYVCYLSRAISANNPGSMFKIGIIAPYRAQADMIDKLLASEKLPSEVEVQVGTIHGFQGDECDIIFAVFNTPPTISSSKEMFLNKRNIINVSISRARDYLFIVMPDDNTEGISNLRLVKCVERLIQSTDEWNEFLSPDLEDLMFSDSNYLENNAFSTSHQSVNVYGLPERRYEIRTEDNVVDVQLHRVTPGEIVFQTTAEMPKVANTDDVLSQETLCAEASSARTNGLTAKGPQRDSIEICILGTYAGRYSLVPYNGKMKNCTIKPVVSMFIPQMRHGKERMIPVSVVEEDRIIYISKENYKMYRKGLTAPEGVELRTAFSD